MDYESMLEEGLKQLPEDVIESGRFTIPKVMGHIQGNKTVINNFHTISQTLGRKPAEVQKYLLKELATPGQLTRSALIIGAKVPASKINMKIQQFAKLFVLCYKCSKPETKLSKEQNVLYMTCQACGARHPVRAKL